MVSSDFGKLEVQRHFSSGIDCAMAGMATAEAAVAAPPRPAALRNSRRFMVFLPKNLSGRCRPLRWRFVITISATGETLLPDSNCAISAYSVAAVGRPCGPGAEAKRTQGLPIRPEQAAPQKAGDHNWSPLQGQ